MRITDADDHRWPITGHDCPVCDMPTATAFDGRPHPGCDPEAQELSMAEVAAALRRITDHLGGAAVVVEGRWLVSREPLRAAVSRSTGALSRRTPLRAAGHLPTRTPRRPGMTGPANPAGDHATTTVDQLRAELPSRFDGSPTRVSVPPATWFSGRFRTRSAVA